MNDNKVILETKRGIIEKVVFKKRFGFIRQEDGSRLFFHVTGLIKPEFEDLREGMPVEYFVVESFNKQRAIGLVAG